MKKLMLIIILAIIASPVANISAQSEKEKKNILIKNWFIDYNTYMIICKGYPKVGTSGYSSINTAREAALINAQFIARDIFDKSVNVVRNGTVIKYEQFDDYVIIHYEIKKKGLKNRLRK